MSLITVILLTILAIWKYRHIASNYFDSFIMVHVVLVYLLLLRENGIQKFWKNMPIGVPLKMVYIACMFAKIFHFHNCEYEASTCLSWIRIHSFGFRNIHPCKFSHFKHSDIIVTNDLCVISAQICFFISLSEEL